MAYSEKKRDQFIKMLRRSGGDIKKAAASIGVSRYTIYNWKKKDKSLARLMEEVREEAVFEIEDCLFDNAKRGNVTAQIFILTNLYPDKYRHVSKIELNKTENELGVYTDAELVAQINEIAKQLNIPVDEVEGDLNGIEDISYKEIDG